MTCYIFADWNTSHYTSLHFTLHTSNKRKWNHLVIFISIWARWKGSKKWKPIFSLFQVVLSSRLERLTEYQVSSHYILEDVNLFNKLIITIKYAYYFHCKICISLRNIQSCTFLVNCLLKLCHSLRNDTVYWQVALFSEYPDFSELQSRC